MSAVRQGSLFAGIPADLPAERFDRLFERPGVRVERILSRGHGTPWLDQDEDEWVVLVAGGAEVEVAGEAEPRRLGPGDWLLLPANTRHRVTWTEPEAATVWVAVHAGRGE